MNVLRLTSLWLLCALLTACVSQTVTSTSVPAIASPSVAVSEARLLDVGVAIFDPGIADYDESKDEQVYPEVRKAEARYMPTLLSEAMQGSAAWGAVRVVPNNDQVTDLMVQGKILHSDGQQLQLHILATDSRGEVWLDRNYTGTASRYSYEATTRTQYDPFQAVYHTIANDLLRQQEKLKLQDRDAIRLVTELLFARGFSPEAFEGYLEQDRKGRYQVNRLPAADDPMLARVVSIRERNYMFVDTLQDYYKNFGYQMITPYQEWRKLSYEEAMALQELKSESLRNLIAGGLAVVAGLYGAGACNSNSGACRAASGVAIIGGGYLLKSGLEKRNEAQIHVQALEELGMSLEAEITPQVIELEDRTVTLSGNVEDQYAQWRQLLADIYRTEIGSLQAPEDAAAATDTL